MAVKREFLYDKYGTCYGEKITRTRRVKVYRKVNINDWLAEQCEAAIAELEADKKTGGKNRNKILANAGNIGLGFHGAKFSMSGYKPVLKKEKNRFVNLTKPGVFPVGM
jgi:hypothetical protein